MSIFIRSPLAISIFSRSDLRTSNGRLFESDDRLHPQIRQGMLLIKFWPEK